MTLYSALCVLILCSVSGITLVKGGFFSCWLTEFECGNGDCINLLKKCDGEKNCEDGSDEVGCGDSVKNVPTTASTTINSSPVHNTRTTRALSTIGVVIPGTKGVFKEPGIYSVTVKRDTEVKLHCTYFGPKPLVLSWYKSDSGHLPDNVKDKDGLLIISRVKCRDRGTYVCVEDKTSNPYSYVAIKLDVDPDTCLPHSPPSTPGPYDGNRNLIQSTTPGYNPIRRIHTYTTGYDHVKQYEISTEGIRSTFKMPMKNGTFCCSECAKDKCRENEFQCGDGTCISGSLRCDGKIDCPDKADERSCKGGACQMDGFRCDDGSCVPYEMHCDGEIDCPDSSDERWCRGPKILELPKSKVDVDCMGDTDVATSGRNMLQLECKFYGKPLVRWIKHNGQVPSNCVQSSIDGHGILKCPNFQQSDQGAYSCMAKNSYGSSISQPKSIVKCNRITCNAGFIVVDEDKFETCLDCFCSGKTKECTKIDSSLAIYEIRFPTEKVDVFVGGDGEVALDSNAISPQKVKYCSVPEDTLKSHSFIRSYGRYMNVPKTLTGKTSFVENAPDVIIRGNGLLLKYMNKKSSNFSTMDIRFWKGSWHHNDKRIASRHDIMKVLAGLDKLLIRCEYEAGKVVAASTLKLILESSKVSNVTTSVSYLEKCTCPIGYDGLSCELCAPGYERSGSTCQRVSPPISCPIGTREPNCDCDKDKGYYLHNKNKTCVKSNCFKAGSLNLFPDFNDKCVCKTGVTGEHCTRCKEGYFNLDERNPSGCMKCWCNGATTKCDSADWYRTTISSTSWGGYDASDGVNFWLLPPEFNGNWLGSYGGFLHYTMKYQPNIPKQPNPLTVEILGVSGATLRYTDSGIDGSTFGNEKVWNVPIEEPHWRDANSRNIVSREELLQVLTHVLAVHIESPYPLSSGKANITRVDLDVAEEISNSALIGFQDVKALKVEKCECPEGYAGLSCETCSDGYYKKEKDHGGFACVLCECENCHPERGCIVCKKDEYQEDPDSVPPKCKKCPCNGNEESCVKDDYGQVICTCKPGYTGLNCEFPDKPGISHLRVLISPRRVINRKVSSTVIFNCSYDSTEDMRIEFHKWFRNNLKPEVVDASSQISKLENNSTMTSVEVTIEKDLETVECILVDVTNKVAGRVSANIMGTTTSYVKPQITTCYDEPKHVFEGDDLELICDANGVPEPVIQWYKKDGSQTTEVDTVSGVYVSSPATFGMNGTVYVCIAKNDAGEDKCYTHVVVMERCEVLTINPKNVIVNETDSARFDCSTTNQAPVTWSRADGSLPKGVEISGGSLIVKEVELYHAGEYQCSAWGSEGLLKKSAMLNVMEKGIPPKAVILEEDAQLVPGQKFEINCDVTGRPEPDVSWKKIGDAILPRGANVTNRGRRLVLSNVQFEDSGIYECKAESTLGSSRGRIAITVHEVPMIKLDPKEVYVLTGNNFTLDCVVLKGEPTPKITWRTPSSHFTESSKISKGERLTVRNALPSTDSMYECQASNNAGIAVARSKVIVGTMPTVKLSSEGTVKAIISDYFDITCNASGTPKPTIKWLKWLTGQSKGKGESIPEELKVTSEDISIEVTDNLRRITCLAENAFGSANKSVDFDLQGTTGSTAAWVKRAPIGSRVELLFPDLVGQIKCRRQDSPLIGDECYINNGLEIGSVQVQHNGTYVCESATGVTKSYSLQVVGFVNKFSKMARSYIVLPIEVKSPQDLSVEITFKADRETGLILLKKKHHGFAMYLIKGRLRVRLRRKDSHHVVLSTTQILKPGVWYTAVFKAWGKAELSLYDEQGKFMESTSDAPSFDIDWSLHEQDDLYVGGANHNERRLFRLIRPNEVSFEGCVSRLIVDGHEYKITEEGKRSKNVSLCNVCSATVDPCGEEGVCRNAPTQYGYICVCGKGRLCPESCRGLGCQTKHDLCKLLNPCGQPENKCVANHSRLECKCAKGYSGVTCEKEERFEFGLDGEGYIKLPPSYLPRHTIREPEHIAMMFTAKKPGILFFQGDARNYLYIKVTHDGIDYIYHNQGSSLDVSADFESSEFGDENHSLSITRRNNTVEIDLDGVIHRGTTEFRTNRVHGDIYIGGVPKNISVPIEHYFVGFNGCIHNVILGDENSPINIMEWGITRHNHRLTCGSDYEE